ncbi:MAG: hypothetical protein OXI74_04345, partial [Rhodospirillaceae bacterium]|nr:hypothetical protein [Rhodospirillaceae bacterium]
TSMILSAMLRTSDKSLIHNVVTHMLLVVARLFFKRRHLCLEHKGLHRLMGKRSGCAQPQHNQQ